MTAPNEEIQEGQSIVDILRLRAHHTPDRKIYEFLKAGISQQVVTFGELDARARSMASTLQRSGSPGDRVLILLPHDLDYVTAFFGILYAGMIAVPSYPPARAQIDADPASVSRIKNIIRDATPTFILCSERLRDALQSRCSVPELTIIRWLTIEELRQSPSEHWRHQRIDPQSIAHLQYTSGSTSSPKAVMISHANIVANLEMIRASFGLNQNSVGLSWLPFFHDMGLANALSPVYVGFPVILMSPSDFTRRPYRWLKAISDYRVTGSGGPNFAYDLCVASCTEQDKATLDLTSWAMAFNGAEPVRPETLQSFATAFQSCGFQPAALRTCYGLAEATVLAAVVPESSPTRTKRFIRELLENGIAREDLEESEAHRTTQIPSCGVPPPGVSIAIVHPDTLKELPPGEIGEVLLAGENIALGYWNHPEETNQQFNISLKGRTDKFLRTGDLGFCIENELYISGRLKDLIILRGRNIHPQDIETVVTEDPDCRRHTTRCVAFSVDRGSREELALVCECMSRNQSEFPSIAEGIRARVSESLELPVSSVVLVSPRSLPLASSGKIQRFRCRELFLTSKLSVLYGLTTKDAGHKEAEVTIPKPCAYLLKYESNPLSSRTLEELGIDSLDLAQLAYEFEKAFPGFEHERVELTALYRLSVRECYELFANPTSDRFQVIWSKLTSQAHPPLERSIRQDSLLSSSYSPGAYTQGLGDIFLTGGTGFVGSYLLSELVRRTKDNIYLLVRSRGGLDARGRIEESLAKYGLLSDMAPSDLARLRILSGDLEKPQLGLTLEQWKEVAERCCTVVHNGANVNYVSTYSRMRAANVEGTREILNLCAATRHKRLHYVSSTFIFGWAKGLVFEDDRHPSMSDVDFGYSESKWGAEQLVWQAIDRGLVATIYRPAMLTASSSFEFSTSDITAALLLYCINHRVSIAMPNQISIMPIDFFARRFVDFMLLPELPHSAYHFTMPYSSVPEICGSISRQFGLAFNYLSLEGFSQHLKSHCGPDDPFFPFINFYQRHFRAIALMDKKRYVRGNYEQVCRDELHGLADPAIDDVVSYIIHFYQRHGLIKVPMRAASMAHDNRRSPLDQAAPS